MGWLTTLTTPRLAHRSTDVLEKVVEYLLYWYKNVDKTNVPDMDIPPELCLQLLQAADYLGLDSKPPVTAPSLQRGAQAPNSSTRTVIFVMRLRASHWRST